VTAGNQKNDSLIKM